MSDPYAKAINQNILHQKKLSRRKEDIDVKKRRVITQLWFDKRELHRELESIQTRTPTLDVCPLQSITEAKDEEKCIKSSVLDEQKKAQCRPEVRQKSSNASSPSLRNSGSSTHARPRNRERALETMPAPKSAGAEISTTVTKTTKDRKVDSVTSLRGAPSMAHSEPINNLVAEMSGTEKGKLTLSPRTVRRIMVAEAIQKTLLKLTLDSKERIKNKLKSNDSKHPVRVAVKAEYDSD